MRTAMEAKTTPQVCAGCKANSEKLKHCARCRSEYYCSRDCQKAHWKQHKKVCGKTVPNVLPPPGASPLDSVPEAPFHKLSDETWLHDRSENDTFKILIDTYRFRTEDNYNLEGKVDSENVAGGAPDSSAGLRRFLSLIAEKPKLLPSWWTPEKADQCVEYGLNTNEWQSLKRTISKAEIIDYYKNSYMPMQLRLFGEQVYGTGPGGQGGKMILQAMKNTEAGGGISEIIGMH